MLKSDLLLQQLSDSGRSWHTDSWNALASKAVEMKEKRGGVGSRLQPRLEPDQGCLSVVCVWGGVGGLGKGNRKHQLPNTSTYLQRKGRRLRINWTQAKRGLSVPSPLSVKGRCPCRANGKMLDRSLLSSRDVWRQPCTRARGGFLSFLVQEACV